MPRARAPIIAIIGGYLSANRGGVAMTLVVHRHVQGHGGSSRLLTLYPEADRRHPPDAMAVTSWRPLDLLISLPFALLMAAARALRLPSGWLARTAGLRALRDADLVVDVAGISFVDGRGMPILGYNVLMTGIPLLAGTPVIKASQAIGPFEKRLNRWAARAVLPRVHTVCARGDRTEAHLRGLGLGNVRPAADLAFVLEVTEQDRERAASELTRIGASQPFVAVVPSAVVEQHCDARGIAYVEALADLCRSVLRTGRAVVIVPHSINPNGTEGRMHDLPVCRELHESVADDRCHLVDSGLGPGALRALIERGDALVASRFHAMISGLATATPTLVTGWSHKYAEVMREFSLEQWAIDYSELGGEQLARHLTRLLDESEAIRASIRGALPGVQSSALGSLVAIDDAWQELAQ